MTRSPRYRSSSKTIHLGNLIHISEFFLHLLLLLLHSLLWMPRVFVLLLLKRLLFPLRSIFFGSYFVPKQPPKIGATRPCRAYTLMAPEKWRTWKRGEPFVECCYVCAWVRFRRLRYIYFRCFSVILDNGDGGGTTSGASANTAPIAYYGGFLSGDLKVQFFWGWGARELEGGVRRSFRYSKAEMVDEGKGKRRRNESWTGLHDCDTENLTMQHYGKLGVFLGGR